MKASLEAWGEETRCLRLSERVGIDNAPDFRHFLLELAAAQATAGLVVDLSQVTYFDSAGVAVLIEAMRWGRQHDRPFILLAPAQAVLQALNLATVRSAFTIYESEISARKVLHDNDATVALSP